MKKLTSGSNVSEVRPGLRANQVLRAGIVCGASSDELVKRGVTSSPGGDADHSGMGSVLGCFLTVTVFIVENRGDLMHI